MRQLILPTCLFLTAWSQPADPTLELIKSKITTEKVTAGQKLAAVTATLDDQLTVTPPDIAETISDAADRGEAVNAALDAEPAEHEMSPEGSTFDETGFTTAVLDIPLPAERPTPVPPRRPVPHHVVCETLADAAVDNNIPVPFLIRLIWQESRFDQNAVSPVGAQGVAQFMPSTAAARRLVDPFNPLEAIRASASLLRDLFTQFGNLGLAAAAYNAGPKRVQDWLARRGSLPKETRDYVQRITGVDPEHWKTQTSAPAIRVAAQVPCQREAGLLAADGPEQIPLPPVVHDDSQPAEKTVQAVAALSQKRKGSRAAAPVRVAQLVQKSTAKPKVEAPAKPYETKASIKQAAETKASIKQAAEVKASVKRAAQPKASIKQAAHALKASKHSAVRQASAAKPVTKTISARANDKKARGKPVKFANASAK